ncbi:MAG: MerR family transcriptional regulator [Clostridia bacterium]|nr:MerR family transcriptional regulator [Clostridia bacterium]
MIDRNEVSVVNGLTVKQVSELSGVSIRTLQYYDNIGLLTPSERTEAGYRLYGEEQLATLQEILLFRELEFPLKEIKAILGSPDHDREKALRQQVELLTLKKERLEGLIRLANDLRIAQGKNATSKNRAPEKNSARERKTTMDFTAFDKTKLEEYAKRAREEYSGTDAYKEYEVKSAGRTAETEAVLGEGLMAIFAQFGKLLTDGTSGVSEGGTPADPASPAAQTLVRELQDYITEHFYTCTPEILAGLGKMYTADGEFKENIDRCGGDGTAVFVSKAIDHFTQRSA